MNEGPTAEAQLIVPLGFVVIQSFHSSLRLWGRKQEKVKLGDSSRERHLRGVFSLGNRRLQPKVTVPSAGRGLALRGRGASQSHQGAGMGTGPRSTSC